MLHDESLDYDRNVCLAVEEIHGYQSVGERDSGKVPEWTLKVQGGKCNWNGRRVVKVHELGLNKGAKGMQWVVKYGHRREKQDSNDTVGRK